MIRIPPFIGAALVVLVAACTSVQTPTTQQIVDEARETVLALKTQSFEPSFADTLATAHAVAIFPNLYKGAFFWGAEGGNGIVLARDANGAWSGPAFYSLASGSFGFQFGGQKARTVLILRTPGALKAIIDNQAKLGADIGFSVATTGAGLEGATTTNLGADIIAFNDAVGLYGGFSLEGGGLIRRNDFNQDYYGQASEPNDILMARTRTNPRADALRAALSGR